MIKQLLKWLLKLNVENNKDIMKILQICIVMDVLLMLIKEINPPNPCLFVIQTDSVENFVIIKKNKKLKLFLNLKHILELLLVSELMKILLIWLLQVKIMLQEFGMEMIAHLFPHVLGIKEQLHVLIWLSLIMEKI